MSDAPLRGDEQTGALSRAFAATVNDNDVVVTSRFNNPDMAIIESTPHASEDVFNVAAKWLIDPAGAVVDVSPAERTDRARATTLAIHAVRREVRPGLELVTLSNKLRAELSRRGSRRSAASAPTVVSAYLRYGHTGLAFAVVDGELTHEDLSLDASVDAIAWLDGTEWRFDVFSVCKRAGGYASECRDGRVRRCVRLATDLLTREGGRGVVRVFNPLHGLVPVVNLAAFTLSPAARQALLGAEVA